MPSEKTTARPCAPDSMRVIAGSRSVLYALPSTDPLPLNAAHLQILLVIQTIDALAAHHPALPTKQHGQTPIPIAHVLPQVLAIGGEAPPGAVYGSCTACCPKRSPPPALVAASKFGASPAPGVPVKFGIFRTGNENPAPHLPVKPNAESCSKRVKIAFT